jgi:hypothetical protein
MSRKAPFISRKYALGDWGNAKYEDNFFFDEETNEWSNDTDKAMTLLSEMLGEMFVWLSEGNMQSKGYKECVARKSIAMVWCMRPDLLQNKSLRQISKMGGVSFTPASLSKHVAFFTEKFGRFHNGTKSDEAKENYKASAKLSHKRRKQSQDKHGK